MELLSKVRKNHPLLAGVGLACALSSLLPSCSSPAPKGASEGKIIDFEGMKMVSNDRSSLRLRPTYGPFGIIQGAAVIVGYMTQTDGKRVVIAYAPYKIDQTGEAEVKVRLAHADGVGMSGESIITEEICHLAILRDGALYTSREKENVPSEWVCLFAFYGSELFIAWNQALGGANELFKPPAGATTQLIYKLVKVR